MKYKVTILILCLFLIPLASSLLACPDSNMFDINNIPCLGVTLVLNCTGNITQVNLNTSEIIILNTSSLGNGQLNFTFNATEGSYSLIDCANNTATIVVGVFEEGYGIGLLGLILPAVLLSFGSLWFSYRQFKGLSQEEEEEKEVKGESGFVPKNRLIPIVFMLFAFIPIIFMIASILLYLQKFFEGSNFVSLYEKFYIGIIIIYGGIFIISFISWLGDFINIKRVEKELIFDDM